MISAMIQIAFMPPVTSSRRNRSMKTWNQIMMAMIQKKMIAIVQKKSQSVPLNISYLGDAELGGTLRQRIIIVRHGGRRPRVVRPGAR
jgi:hypothetical protein